MIACVVGACTIGLGVYLIRKVYKHYTGVTESENTDTASTLPVLGSVVNDDEQIQETAGEETLLHLPVQGAFVNDEIQETAVEETPIHITVLGAVNDEIQEGVDATVNQGIVLINEDNVQYSDLGETLAINEFQKIVNCLDQLVHLNFYWDVIKDPKQAAEIMTDPESLHNIALMFYIIQGYYYYLGQTKYNDINFPDQNYKVVMYKSPDLLIELQFYEHFVKKLNPELYAAVVERAIEVGLSNEEVSYTVYTENIDV